METATPINPLIAPDVEPDGPPTGVQGGYDQQAPPEPDAREEESREDVLDILVPKADVKRWEFGPNKEYEFTQRPLSFIAKMQWFSLVGDVLDKALSGENGMSLNSLMSAPGRPGELSMADFRDADTFIQAIGKLLSVAPDFLVKSYCIWLNVPDWQRGLVGEAMSEPEEFGGLSDADGIEIIERFIDQNYQALDDFFRDRLSGLATRVQNRASEATKSRQSKR